MMEALIGIGGGFVVVAVFGLLSRLEVGRRRRMLADVTKAKPVKRYDLDGELLPREETSLGPVRYERIPTAPAYQVETRQPRHVHNLETGVAVPAATAGLTALCVTLAAGALALAFGWPAKTLLIVFALSLVGAWLWRLGVADRILWSVEAWTGKDLDHDHQVGRPSLGFAVVNPAAARATVAHESAQNDAQRRTEALQAFCDKCYLSGTSEAAHGVQASGPDRDNYVACRNTLFSLGLAQWRNPDRPKGGWVMVADPATCKGIVANHAVSKAA
jgi:hypothetical protein